MKGSWANALEEDEIAQLYEIQYWFFKVCLKSGQLVQPSLALLWGRDTSHCPGQLCGFCCLGQYFHNQQCVTMNLTACPSLGPETLAPHPFPSFPTQSGCHEDGAGSPPLSQVQRVFTAQWKPRCGSHCSGLSMRDLRGSVLLHCTPGALLQRGTGKTWEQQWRISCTYRAAAKVSEKLVLKTNLIACRSNFSGVHFLALILCIAVCVSEQNLIILHPYEPWWLHAASAE